MIGKMSVYTRCLALLVITGLISQGAYAQEDVWSLKRKYMVDSQIRSRGVVDNKVLEVMNKVERHLFVPEYLNEMAYEDMPIPIGHNQTISQPYIVALMTEAARLHPGDRVLEVGTGSGYQAAVLAEIVKEVYTIEIVKPLADSAAERLKKIGYKNIKVKWGDGYDGWEEYAPYDVVIITAAPPNIPEKLIDQLKIGGRMVVPVGQFFQELVLITRTESGYDRKDLIPVRFVPMVHSRPEK